MGDEYKETAAAGEVVGHAISVVIGVHEVVTGVGGLLGSGAVTLGTAGAATPITAGTGTASAGLVLHGTTTAASAINGLYLLSQRNPSGGGSSESSSGGGEAAKSGGSLLKRAKC